MNNNKELITKKNKEFLSIVNDSLNYLRLNSPSNLDIRVLDEIFKALEEIFNFIKINLDSYDNKTIHLSIQLSKDVTNLEYYIKKDKNTEVQKNFFDQLKKIEYDLVNFLTALKKELTIKNKQKRTTKDDIYIETIKEEIAPSSFFERIMSFITGEKTYVLKQVVVKKRVTEEDVQEETLWNKTKSIDKIGSYLTFIKRFPKSSFAKDAKQRMNIIAEENLWKKVSAKNTIEAYSEYIKKYPKGVFIEIAKANIEKLEEEYLSNEALIENIETDKIKISSTFEYDVFLCYSNKEKDLATIVFERLTKAGFKTFFAGGESNQPLGQSFSKAIIHALENSQHFILFCSPNAMESRWVEVEFKHFFEEIHMKNIQNRQFFILKGNEFEKFKIPTLLNKLPYIDDITQIIATLKKERLSKYKIEQFKQYEFKNDRIDKLYVREDIFQLAIFSAFPLHITADLLYKIWQNFKNTEGGNEIPRIAVSDLLLSGLLQEVSTELFEYPPDLRRSLLLALQQYYSPRDILKDMGEFMLDYLATHYAEGVAYTEPIREAEEWNALAYYDPAKAHAKLEAILNPSAAKNYQTRQLRAVMLTEKLEGQAALRTLDASQKTGFERILTISKGIKPYIQGDFGKAYEQLQLLPDFKISSENLGNTEGVATLEMPKAVVPVPKVEEKIVEKKPTLYPVLFERYSIGKKDTLSLDSTGKFFLDFIEKHLDSQYNLKIYRNSMDLVNENKNSFGENDITLFYMTDDGVGDKWGIDPELNNNIVFIADTTNFINLTANNKNIIFISSISPNQIAYKVRKGENEIGLFTQKFVEVLQDAEKPLNYSELFSRVYTKVTQQTDKQHPQIQAFGTANLQDLFLNGMLKPQNTEGVVLPKMKVGFGDSLSDDLKSLFREVFREEGESLFFELVEDNENTDYTIQYDSHNKEYTLQTSVGDNLMFPPAYRNRNGIITFCNNIDSVANWQYTLDINGEASNSLDHKAVDINFYNLGIDTNKTIEPTDWRQPIVLELEEDKPVNVQLSVQNMSHQPYWVSILYLSKDFGVSNEYFKPKLVLALDSEWLQFGGNNIIPLMIQDEFIKQGKTSLTEYFKIFISTKKFNIDDLNRDPLSIETKNLRNIGTRSSFQKRDFAYDNMMMKTVVVTLKLKDEIVQRKKQLDILQEDSKINKEKIISDTISKIVKDNMGLFLTIAKTYSTDSNDSKDIIQDSIVDVFSSLSKMSIEEFEKIANIKYYIARAISHKGIMKSKHQNRTNSVDDFSNFNHLTGLDEYDIERKEEENIILNRIDQIKKLVSGEDFELLVKWGIGKLSYKVIATEMGLTESQVKNRIQKLRKQLKGLVD